jgi:aminoglycoside phosphotransferase (APT) family kinase protein
MTPVAAMLTLGDLRAHRQHLISPVLGRLAIDPRAVVSMQLAAGGNSRETWIIELDASSDRRRLVFRCDPDHWIRPQQMSREIDGLKLAHRAGVPAPQVLLSSDDLDIGRPYVVSEYVPGTSLARRIIRDAQFAEARQRFASQCGEILARLHSAGEHASHWPTEEPIEELERYRLDAAYPSPVLAGAIRWLSKHRPPASSAPSPVHRDFRLGNLMIDHTGIVAVLDWETCHLSDPCEDLAWLCSRAWRYGGELPVGGIGELRDLLDSYARHSGRKIDAQRLHWWRVFAAARWALASGARPRAGSAGDAMEEAAIARQVCRQEHYVLLELGSVP